MSAEVHSGNLQVSFVTNNKLWDTRENDDSERRSQRLKLGIFGL